MHAIAEKNRHEFVSASFQGGAKPERHFDISKRWETPNTREEEMEAFNQLVKDEENSSGCGKK